MADAPDRRRRARLLLGLITGSVRALGPARHPLGTLIAVVWYAKQPPAVRRRAADSHRRLDRSLSARAARRRARASYREYVWMILDGIWAEPLDARGLLDVVDVEGAEWARGRNAIMVTSHFGNWDIGVSTASALDMAMTTVMAPFGGETMTAMVEISRARKGFELFAPRHAARGLIRALRRGRWVGLMLDVPEAGPTVVVPFCGGPVRVSAVPARLATGTATPIVPAACWRVGDRWRVRIHPPMTVDPLDDDTTVMARVAAILEPEIRRHPEQWYPFHEVYADGGG